MRIPVVQQSVQAAELGPALLGLALTRGRGLAHLLAQHGEDFLQALLGRIGIEAGLLRQLAAGAYSYLPLGYRTLRKVEAIVREEMNRAGAVELHMPALQPLLASQLAHRQPMRRTASSWVTRWATKSRWKKGKSS